MSANSARSGNFWPAAEDMLLSAAPSIVASLAVLVRTAGALSSPVLPRRSLERLLVPSIVSEQRGCSLFHRERVAWETAYYNHPVHRV